MDDVDDDIYPEEGGEAPETGFDSGDDPLDEAPFTAEELMRLAAELLPDAVRPQHAIGRT